MCAAVGTLALLALLTGARAATASEDHDACDGTYTKPRISATCACLQYRTFGSHCSDLYPSYGDEMAIYCNGSDSSKLTIMNNTNGKMQAIRENSTTVQLSLGNPNIGVYSYNCTDSSTGCGDCLIVKVSPKISVSPEVKKKKGFGFQYFVPLGQEYSVICEANEIKNLRMNCDLNCKRNWGKIPLPTEDVNQTAIKHVTRADRVGRKIYSCHDTTRNIHVTQLSTSLRVDVDHFPGARDFRCISYNERNLECSWISIHKNHNFILYKTERGETTFLCSDTKQDLTRSCKCNMEKISYDSWLTGMYLTVSHLILQSCNEYVCANQTFTMDHLSNLKLDPPAEIRILNISSRRADLAWRGPAAWPLRITELQHRLEYRLLGAAWQEANTSSVICFVYCNFHLHLQCPNAHYQIKLYVRSAKATEDRFWSEPASIFFFTKRPKAEAVNPECNQKYKQRKPLPTAADMFYEAGQLINYEREKDMRLLSQVDTLMAKRDEIKVLTELLNRGV